MGSELPAGDRLRDTLSAFYFSSGRMGAMATETGCNLDSGSQTAGAWKLPGQRMLSPERLALPDYEYLGRGLLSASGKGRSDELGEGVGRRQGRS